MTKYLLWLAIAGFFISCSPSTTNTTATTTEQAEEKPPLEGLPMLTLNLDATLAESNEGWSAVGSVYQDFYGTNEQITQDGEGIMISTGSEDGQMNTLNLNVEHQDIDLSFEFSLPDAGQAQLLLQGQYAVELNDSWGEPSNYIGAIQDNEVKDMNTCKAPGLWQQFSASFHAPRFDEAGNVTQKATLEDVKLNDMIIHSSLELDSDNPLVEGPLQFLGSNQVAIRNIEYKSYGLDSLRLDNIRYDLFFGDWDKLPDFSNLEVAKSGTADFLDVKVAGQPDKYALKFYGDLYVPTDGEYFIQTTIDDGGELFIDGELVLHNDGEPNIGTEQTLTTLSAGKHDFEITYFQDHWGTALVVVYEGPEITKQILPTDPDVKRWLSRKDNRVLPVSESLQETELLRGFANYKDKKLTHVISVGTPEGIHFL
ncbi:MAG: PA14 domain-containing protein, partial [Bacteroidota bacterium]